VPDVPFSTCVQSRKSVDRSGARRNFERAQGAGRFASLLLRPLLLLLLLLLRLLLSLLLLLLLRTHQLRLVVFFQKL
jgi:hypothetical protein